MNSTKVQRIDKERAASRYLSMNYDMNRCHEECHLIAYYFILLTDSSSMLMLAAPCTNPQNLPEQDKPSHPELQKTPSLVPAVAKTSEIKVDNKDTGGGGGGPCLQSPALRPSPLLS